MFDITKISVSDSDIAKVEEHFGFAFNEEQKCIIRTWNTVNIQACPGSGKTTTLAAKLMILAEKLPKSFQQGICIITHTNIAVNEIKRKLGVHADFYNNYPHHFGTIQSFVDKYLAIPAYKLEYKQSPKIETDLCIDRIEKKSKNEYGAMSYLNRKKIESMGDLFFNINNFGISKKLNDTDAVVGINSPTYQSILRVKNEVLLEGYLKYDEAYSLAFKYLRENVTLINLFSKRFPIVFIDEMQDMESHQSKLINDLFGEDKSIIQKIGDINQSIFSPNTDQEKSDFTIKGALKMNLTTRLSHYLAEIVKPICLDPQPMEGNWNPNPIIKPTIIVFDDITKEKVKEKFVEKIIQHRLNELHNATFKAVGYRKGLVSNDKLNINSYWPYFSKNTAMKSNEEFENLHSYLGKCQVLASKKNVKEIRKTLLDGICKALKLSEIKNPLTNYYFTPFTFMRYFLYENEIENNKLQLNLAKWIINFNLSADLKNEIVVYIKYLLPIFNKQTNNKLLYFLNDSTTPSENQKETNQVFEHLGIKVHFDTIHGVKGETHTATLYLETYKNKVFDIGDKILEFIVSPENKKNKLRLNKSNKSFQNKLPYGYVAMSRATHLLCLAVHKDRFNDNFRAYFSDINNGWEIV